MVKAHIQKIREAFYFIFFLALVPVCLYGSTGKAPEKSKVVYVLTCSEPTDLCNPGNPPELTVTPAGAQNYDFYVWQDFTNSYFLMQSGTNNVLPINFSSSRYYCEVTVNGGTQVTNEIQMRCIYPVHWSITHSSGSNPVCGGETLTMLPSVWDSYQWYRNAIPIPGANSNSYYATQPGIYNCFVTNSCGGDTAYYGHTITTVHPVLPVNPLITITPGTSLCVGQPITLIAPAVPGCNYKWYRYLQTGYTLNMPSGINADTLVWITLPETGSERYKVEMQNGCGTKTSAIVTVVWTQNINASFSTSGPLQFCPGGNVTLTATQNNAWNYQWQKNNVNISGATLNSYNANTTGAYRLNISDANGCSNSLLREVSASGPDAKSKSSYPFCTNTQEYFFTEAGNGFSYQWYKNGALIPGANNDTVPVTSATNGAFYVIANSACGADTSSASPQYPFTAPATASITSSGPTNFCSDDSVMLYGNYGINYTYQWSKNGIDFPDGDYYAYKAKTSGFYNVKVSNNTGCGNMATGIQVNAYSNPAPVITPNGAVTFCSGSNVTLSTTNTSGASYQWKKNGVPISGATTNSYTTSASGTYKVQKTNPAGCTGTSAGKSVTVNGLPAATATPQGPASFCAGDSVVIKGNYNSTYLYQWKKNNTNITVATTHKYTAKTAGNYKVKVTNTNGCTKISTPVTISVPCRESQTGLSDGYVFNAVAFPNPSPGDFNFQLQNAGEGPTLIEIFDATGRVVLSVNTSDPTFIIPGGKLPAGVYQANITNGHNKKILKILKTD